MAFFDNLLNRFGYSTNDLSDQGKKIDIEADGSYETSAQMQETNFNFDFVSSSEADLISTYRRISHSTEVAAAIDEIVNEIIVNADDKSIVELLFEDDFEYSDEIRDDILEAFERTLRLLKFKENAYEIFKDWYVDSRIAFIKNLNKEKNKVISLTQLDAKKLRKIRIVNEDDDGMLEVQDEFFAYLREENSQEHKGNSNLLSMSSNDYMAYRKNVMYKIPVQLITFVDSGLVDKTSNIIYGHLHKAVKPASQLEMVESSSVVHRLSRSKDQRVIYVNTGNLNPAKSNQLLERIKRQFRNNVSYDTTKGTLTTSNRTMSLREDLFMSRRNGDQSTEIDNITPSAGFENLDDLEYFKDKLYNSLNVPLSRYKDSNSVFAQNSEITREELKFDQFVDRLRMKFANVFWDLLRTELILGNIIKPSEWKLLKDTLNIRYNKNNYFAELKKLELMERRIEAVDTISEYVEGNGKYFSHDTVRKDILLQTEEDIEREDKQIKKEKNLFSDENNE